MPALPVSRGLAVLTRKGQVVGRLREVNGRVGPAGQGLSEVNLRGELVGQPSYWLAEGVEVEVTWTFGPGRRAARFGAAIAIMRYEVETNMVSVAGVARLSVGGSFEGPLAAE
jgi:hypothetical protein